MNLNLGMNLLTEPAPTTWVIIKGTSYVWQNLAVYRFELSDVQLACSVVTVHMDINHIYTQCRCSSYVTNHPSKEKQLSTTEKYFIFIFHTLW